MNLTKEQKELIEKNNWDVEAIDAYLSLDSSLELTKEDLKDFDEAYQGRWDSDEDFIQELVKSMGDIPKDFPSYIHIDWEDTARDIMRDYSDENGHYFRNL